jgi:predicted GNAT family acetyltransferase
MSAEPEVTVVDNPGKSRFEIRVGPAVAGYSIYRTAPGRVIFTHTEIDPAYEGRGLGARLAAEALDQVRARGLQVTPFCPFIARFIERHPAYADLVAPER